MLGALWIAATTRRASACGEVNAASSAGANPAPPAIARAAVRIDSRGQGADEGKDMTGEVSMTKDRYGGADIRSRSAR
jgi:hypothetical protein